MRLKNRIVMPPIGSNFANLDGSFAQKHYNYYELRAKGGTGLITLENVCVDFPLGSNGTTQLRMDDDQYIPGLWEFNERMHAHGACTSVQINHAGASAYAGRLNGVQQVSSSTIPSKTGMAIPRPLKTEEIYQIIDKYAQAALRAKRAGFDCVEIHAGHSYLISQFLSPLYNDRTDEFGGSKENLARFATLTVQAVRQAVGIHFPICLRISADEFLPGGNTLEDTLELLDFFVEDVDIINVSAALNDSIQYQIDKMNLKDGWRSYLAKAVKDKFPNKVIMTSGNIRSPQRAEEILKDGDADLIILGRGLIGDPNWVNKVKTGKSDLIRSCISCNIGCANHRIAMSRPLKCTVNPDLIFENLYKQNQVDIPIKVVVIGGGTTGLEAACSAAEIGAKVRLFEEKTYLGGLAHEIARLPDKVRIDDFVTYLINRSKTLPNLTINLGHRVTMDDITLLAPDVIINASGAKPILPPIPGLIEQLNNSDRHVFSIFDLLNNLDHFKDTQQKTVAVIGGGAVGLDVMEYYAERGAKEVHVVEMQGEVGKDLDLITKVSMMEIAKKYKVKLHLNTKLTTVKEQSFIVEKNGELEEISFDLGFVCLGMKSEAPLMDLLYAYGDTHDVEVLNIGDSKRARRIMEGVREGRDVTYAIHQKARNLKEKQ